MIYICTLPFLNMHGFLHILDETDDIDIRLVDSFNNSYGRVEIGFKGAWGSVCSDGWDIADAQVVCCQLGFTTALAATASSAWGGGSGRVWLSDVNCNGHEKNIQECVSFKWQEYSCSSGEYAVAICSG